jgi:hypothetical protein
VPEGGDRQSLVTTGPLLAGKYPKMEALEPHFLIELSRKHIDTLEENQLTTYD